MAIDSESKRRGSVGAGIPGIAPIQPDGSIDEADRAYLSGSYPQGQQPPPPPPSTMKTVKFFTRTKLSGSDCSNAPFILCLGPDLVAPTVCPETDEDGTYSWSTLEAVLKEPATCKWVCDAVSGKRYQVWEYCFIYQTGELADGVTVLGTKDILGASHKGCFARWVEDLVGNEPYIISGNGGEPDIFVSPHGCEYPLSGGGSCCPFVQSLTDELDESQIPFEDPYYLTGVVSVGFTNPYTDSELVITGGHSFSANVISAGGADALINVEVSINGGGFVNVGGPPRAVGADIHEYYFHFGFLDGLTGMTVPPSSSGTFTVQYRIYTPNESDQVFGYNLSINATAHRNVL